MSPRRSRSPRHSPQRTRSPSPSPQRDHGRDGRRGRSRSPRGGRQPQVTPRSSSARRPPSPRRDPRVAVLVRPGARPPGPGVRAERGPPREDNAGERRATLPTPPTSRKRGAAAATREDVEASQQWETPHSRVVRCVEQPPAKRSPVRAPGADQPVSATDPTPESTDPALGHKANRKARRKAREAGTSAYTNEPHQDDPKANPTPRKAPKVTPAAQESLVPENLLQHYREAPARQQEQLRAYLQLPSITMGTQASFRPAIHVNGRELIVRGGGAFRIILEGEAAPGDGALLDTSFRKLLDGPGKALQPLSDESSE